MGLGGCELVGSTSRRFGSPLVGGYRPSGVAAAGHLVVIHMIHYWPEDSPSAGLATLCISSSSLSPPLSSSDFDPSS